MCMCKNLSRVWRHQHPRLSRVNRFTGSMYTNANTLFTEVNYVQCEQVVQQSSGLVVTCSKPADRRTFYAPTSMDGKAQRQGASCVIDIMTHHACPCGILVAPPTDATYPQGWFRCHDDHFYHVDCFKLCLHYPHSMEPISGQQLAELVQIEQEDRFLN